MSNDRAFVNGTSSPAFTGPESAGQAPETKAAENASRASGELTFRPATEGDLPNILELMRLSLGENLTPRSRAFWKWKHEDNPFGASPVLLAVAPDGTLAGLRVFMRWTWRAGGRDVPAVRAVDTATHPDFRGQGIFKRLTLALADAMAEEGIPFVFNTPNRFSRPGYLKMGWSLVGRLSLWIRPLRPLRMLEALVRAKLLGQETPADESLVLPAFEPAEAALADPELEAFLARVGFEDGPRYTTPRTADYLRWRYGAIPGYDYYALKDLDGGALLVFRGRVRSGLREISLSEVIVRPTREGFASAHRLIGELARRGDADYVVAAGAWGTPEQRALLANLFLPLPRMGLHFTVRPLGDARVRPDPLDLASWRFSVGDQEIF